MFCPNCGIKKASDYNFCPSCGHDVGEILKNENQCKENKSAVEQKIVSAKSKTNYGKRTTIVLSIAVTVVTICYFLNWAYIATGFGFEQQINIFSLSHLFASATNNDILEFIFVMLPIIFIAETAWYIWMIITKHRNVLHIIMISSLIEMVLMIYFTIKIYTFNGPYSVYITPVPFVIIAILLFNTLYCAAVAYYLEQ